VLINDLLGHVEGDGHREDIAIGKTAVLADTGPCVSEVIRGRAKRNGSNAIPSASSHHLYGRRGGTGTYRS
jgi:hypothetical protein